MNLGIAHLAAGRENEGRAFLVQAEAALVALRAQGNDSPNIFGMLVNVHGLLGRREEVLREAPQHIANWAKDRWLGPVAEEDAARAFVCIGENDRALTILERLAVISYAEPITPTLLRLDPAWDKLRQEPRFQKLAQTKP